jgi:hypothetical protein
MPFEAQDKPALPVKAKYRGEGGQRQENQGCVCDLAIYISECPTTRQLPSLLSRWEKRGRGGTEDEAVKPLDGVQRVQVP